MGRAPCCIKEGVTRGAWTALEDKILVDYISAHGEGKWRNIPKFSGLKRCGKSCRLRWLNYLRPDIKRGNISPEEEDLIIRLHKLLGNRWCLIAGRIPGRTDNEIKNYWNTTLRKKVKLEESNAKLKTMNMIESNVVQTNGALWFTKIKSTPPNSSNSNPLMDSQSSMDLYRPDHETIVKEVQSGAESELSMDFNLSDLLTCDFPDSELWKLLDGGGIEQEPQEPFLFSGEALRDFPVIDDDYFNFRA